MLEIFGKKIKKEEAAENAQKKGGRKLTGVVVSDKMKKTVVVAVSYEKKHSKYKKYFRVTKRMKAHDENGEYHTGDNVIIQETRPISKEKRWRVIGKA
ncbi:MAG: 30S ribosomal protein S17 [Patescibacteria group bacterium]